MINELENTDRQELRLIEAQLGDEIRGHVLATSAEGSSPSGTGVRRDRPAPG
ncbi:MULTISPECIES: hypothetical protein [Arthrobacter]|uniref:hypothetical protein n=1 Tax=Arthrobacter TaxID=1663 RepID=UPI0014047BE8|nr:MULTISPECIES: hypothetical protein [Arthrobacter]MBT8162567.1 hypothetical protein [Arthrobacter sp. GN70]